MPVSSAAYGGGHWSDSNTHDDNGGAAAAAAASDIFRDFTWYSAMLLSHLFALEHAQLVRDAAAEEARRRTATAHSPQLLMRAAMAAANAPATSTTHTGVAAAEAVYRGDAAASAKESEGTEGGGQSVAAPAEEETQKLSHLTTQHRPHILLGFTVDGVAVGGHSAGVEAVLSDTATRWAAPTGVAGERRSATGAGDSADTAAATILAVFDAFYFPSELFPGTAISDTAGPGGAEAASHAVSTSRPALPGLYSEDGVSLAPAGEGVDGRGGGGGVEHNAADNVMNEGEGSGTGGSAGAPRVTPEALREAFHTLLLLGQRCATFALSFHGIVGPLSTEDGAADEAVTHQATDNACYFSSEDESRGGGGGGMRSKTGELAAMQQAASATLQFMLQLSCSCPCAPLSYAAQLCLAHALAVQPPPRTASGWAARQQLLRFLPTLQPPSRALMMDGTAASGLQHCSVSPATAASLPTPTGAAAGTGSGSSSSSASNRVPATQYIRAEDPMLWFDASGLVHMTTAQQWWAGQSHSQRPRGACLHAYCGPLPATTALPTVQRLLMEEDQYMGPNGSAAAVLQSVLEAVSTEVTLNARVLPGASSFLVHTSLRRRRGLHGSGSNSSSSSSSASGSQRATGAAAQLSSSPHSTDALLERESSSSGGSPTFPGSTFGSAPGTVALRAQGAAASTSARLSKAAKRRRALLFALAQSHLLPPTLQLTTSKTLLYGVFTDGGECPSYYMLLSLYPDILRAHHTSLHYVLFEDGPLSVDVRLMVATMAASRHRCEYLVSRFSALLLRYAEEAMLDERDDDDGGGGGNMVGEGANTYDSLYHGGGRHGVHSPLHNPRDYDGEEERSGTHHHHAPLPQLPCRGQARQRWITQGPPARLRAVQHLIAITAHTPWTLNEHDIRAVLAAGWTIPEVFQLVAIVAQVVPLCSFVMGMFVPAEPWTMTLLPLEVVERLGHRAVTEESASTSTGGSGSVGGMVSSGSSGALSGLRRGTNMASEGMTGACPGPATPHYSAPGRTLLGTVASGSDVTAMNSTGGNISNTNNSNNNNMNISSDVYRRYAGEDGIVSEQRIKGGSAAVNPHTLWRSQFTWNEVGATSMEQYYPGAATLMSEEIECFFDVVRQLTKADCVGLMSPDYAPSYAFRSLQLYVQNLLGFMVEDYPYNDINKVLRRPAKWFAQVLTMRPETLTRSEVVRWYVPTTPPTGKPSDMSAESSLVTHQLKREIELLSVVDSAQGGHRGGIESASAHPDQADHQPPTPAEAARDAAEAEALQTALTLQDERVLLLIALATMEARKEGLLHILLRPVCSVLSNM